ncbi:MAG: sigma 54-interacting transcriptional regulator [Desulfobacterales bacterium]
MHRENLSEYHNTILDSINEGVFTIDLNWRITSFNKAAERITGVKREQAIGISCSEVFRTNICENACALKRTLAAGNPIVNAMAHIINESGRQIPIRISTALLKDKKGKIIGGVETFQDITQIEQLRKELEARYTFEDIIGRSSAMMDLFQILPRIAESDSTVLIEGASGTGKELFARAIHNLSTRKNNRFVAINCGALPDALLESELFGYKAGAFTDARKEKPGRFTLAHKGTLFLDEIGDISTAMQIRLLRVLQEQRFEPLGAVKTVKVDVRIVAATNKNLTRLVRIGKFREDLFYRIRVIHIKLPELKDRRQDIPLLVNHLVSKLNRIKGKNIFGVSDKVLARLMEYNYPGNVRELENIIEHAFALCNTDLVEPDHLPPEHRAAAAPLGKKFSPPTCLKSMEQTLIKEALNHHGGNRKQAAKELGIDTSTLYRKIKSMKIDTPSTDGRNRK